MSKATLEEGNDPPQGMQGTQLSGAEPGFEAGGLGDLVFHICAKGMGWRWKLRAGVDFLPCLPKAPK